jgi:hypothetical protein
MDICEFATCHSFFIEKSKATNINWKRPYIKTSSMETRVQIKRDKMSEGAMRYAFDCFDKDLNQKLVAKLPKVIYSHSYNVESMGKDLENMVICQRILHEFNDRIVDKISDTSLLLGIVSSFLYELDSDEEDYKIYYAENFIDGDYKKYNNNAGWKANQ